MKDDDALIRRYVDGGDEAAFEALVRHRLPTLRRIVAAAGPRDTADRDDILQEVLIRLHNSLTGYRFDAPFSTWVYRVVRNAALDEVKKRTRRAAREERYTVDTRHYIEPEDRILENEEKSRLKELFYRLDERDRQILLLREREALAMEEIAGILGMKPGTVKSRLHRARKRARRLYEEEME